MEAVVMMSLAVRMFEWLFNDFGIVLAPNISGRQLRNATRSMQNDVQPPSAM
jgi:hypothetical protein